MSNRIREAVEKLVESLKDKNPDQVEEILHDIMTTATIEIGGEQYPVTLSSFIFEYTNVQEEYARMQLQKDKLISHKQEQRSSRFQPKELHVRNINEMRKRKLWTIECPQHGETRAKHLTKSGFRAECGCYASLEVFYERTGFVWYGKYEVNIP